MVTFLKYADKSSTTLRWREEDFGFGIKDLYYKDKMNHEHQ